MRFRRRPTPPPLPMSDFDLVVAGLHILDAVDSDIERLVLDLHNALHCLEESGLNVNGSKFRAQQLITALRVVQAL